MTQPERRLTLHGLELFIRTDLEVPGTVTLEGAMTGTVYLTLPVIYQSRLMIWTSRADFTIYPVGMPPAVNYEMTAVDRLMLCYRDASGLEVQASQDLGLHFPGTSVTIKPPTLEEPT